MIKILIIIFFDSRHLFNLHDQNSEFQKISRTIRNFSIDKSSDSLINRWFNDQNDDLGEKRRKKDDKKK